MSWQEEEQKKREQAKQLEEQTASDVKNYRLIKSQGISRLFDRLKKENDMLADGLKMACSDCSIAGKKENLVKSSRKQIIHNMEARYDGDRDDIYTFEICYNEEKDHYVATNMAINMKFESFRFKLDEAHIIVKNLCCGEKLTNGLKHIEVISDKLEQSANKKNLFSRIFG